MAHKPENPLESLGKNLSSLHLRQNADLHRGIQAGMAAGDPEQVISALESIQKVLNEANSIHDRLQAAVEGIKSDLGYVPQIRLGVLTQHGIEGPTIGVGYQALEESQQPQLSETDVVASQSDKRVSFTPEAEIAPTPVKPITAEPMGFLFQEIIPETKSQAAERLIVPAVEPFPEDMAAEEQSVEANTVSQPIVESPAPVTRPDTLPVTGAPSNTAETTVAETEAGQPEKPADAWDRLDQFADSLLEEEATLSEVDPTTQAEHITQTDLQLTPQALEVAETQVPAEASPTVEPTEPSTPSVVFEPASESSPSAGSGSEAALEPASEVDSQAKLKEILIQQLEKTELEKDPLIPEESPEDVIIPSFVLDDEFVTSEVPTENQVSLEQPTSEVIVESAQTEVPVLTQPEGEKPIAPRVEQLSVLKQAMLDLMWQADSSEGITLASVGRAAYPKEAGKVDDTVLAKRVQVYISQMRPELEKIGISITNLEPLRSRRPGRYTAGYSHRPNNDEQAKTRTFLETPKESALDSVSEVLAEIEKPTVNATETPPAVAPETSSSTLVQETSVPGGVIRVVERPQPSGLSRPARMRPIDDEPVAQPRQEARSTADAAPVADTLPAKGEMNFTAESRRAPETTVTKQEPSSSETTSTPEVKKVAPKISKADAWRLADILNDLSMQDLEVLERNGVDIKSLQTIGRNLSEFHKKDKATYTSFASRERFKLEKPEWEQKMRHLADNPVDTLFANTSDASIQSVLFNVMQVIKNPEQMNALLKVVPQR